MEISIRDECEREEENERMREILNTQIETNQREKERVWDAEG